MDSNAIKDPWHWTPREVYGHFCYLVNSQSEQPLPEDTRRLLQTAIIGNNVDGSKLLQLLETKSLIEISNVFANSFSEVLRLRHQSSSFQKWKISCKRVLQPVRIDPTPAGKGDIESAVAPINLCKPRSTEGGGRISLLKIHEPAAASRNSSARQCDDARRRNAYRKVLRFLQGHDRLDALKQSKGEDQILPLLGDSGSEGGLPESEVDAIEAENMEEMPPALPVLGEEDARRIVFEEEKTMENEWREFKLPALEDKATVIYQKGGTRSRQAFVRQLNLELDHLHFRKRKISEHILRNHWAQADVLRQQCRSLETTVFSILEKQWKAELWRRECSPYNNESPRFERRTRPRSFYNDNEGEGIEIESDADSDELQSMSQVIRRSRALVATEQQAFEERDLMLVRSTTDNVYNGSPPRFEEYDFRDHRTSAPWSDIVVNDEELPDTLLAQQLQAKPGCETSLDLPEGLAFEGNMSGPSITYPLENPFSSPNPSQEANELEVSCFTKPHDDYEAKFYEMLSDDHDKQAKREQLMYELLRKLMIANSVLWDRFQAVVTSMPFLQLKSMVQYNLESFRRGKLFLEGIEQSFAKSIYLLSQFYIAWIDCSEDTIDRISATQLPQHQFLKWLLEDKRFAEGRQFSDFHFCICSIIGGDYAEGRGEVEGWRDDDDDDDATDMIAWEAHARRGKRDFANEIRKSKELQYDAKQRQLQAVFRRSISTQSWVEVNLCRTNMMPPIFVNERLRAFLKPHQIEGVQFIWRELVPVLGKSASMDSLQGCLVAHSMGLGKTLQVIAFLLTLAEAVSSNYPPISDQIPCSLRQPHVLILCPAPLVQNWCKEFSRWCTPEDKFRLGGIYFIEAVADPGAKFRILEMWSQRSGILVLSYDMFGRMLGNSRRDDEGERRVEHCLLELPNLVIADEAHRMKNVKDSLSGNTASSRIPTARQAQRFRTLSRIALTGTPLANHIGDYFNMINWITPNYLGSRRAFNSRFKDPIEKGMDKDCSFQQRREMLKKERILRTTISPKVDRKEIAVLKSELKPKSEFVIAVPLTGLQTNAYCSYIDAVRDTTRRGAMQSFATLHMLKLLVTHPAIFYRHLQLQQERRRTNQGRQENAEVEEESGTIISESAFRDQKALLGGLVTGNVAFSNKMVMLLNILQYSKQAHDQVLVFSQRQPVLDYVEEMLNAFTLSFCRIDGNTPSRTRLPLVEDFNRGKYDIFLISTKAGGEGLNLIGANRVVILDFDFNPQYEEQAIARAFRLGQQKSVFVYWLLAHGTFEEKLFYRNVLKKQISSRLVDQKDVISAAPRPEDMIYYPELQAREAVSQYMGKDCVVLDKILRQPNHSIWSIRNTETFQEEQPDELTAEELREIDKEFPDGVFGDDDVGGLHATGLRNVPKQRPSNAMGFDQFGS